MASYAYAPGGVVAEIVSPLGSIADCYTPAFVAECHEIPTGATVRVGDVVTISGGIQTFAAPTPAPGPSIQQQARTALDVSDMTALRCFKAGVAFPADWQAWTVSLRAIVNGTANPMPTVVPAQPASFPAGT